MCAHLGAALSFPTDLAQTIGKCLARFKSIITLQYVLMF